MDLLRFSGPGTSQYIYCQDALGIVEQPVYRMRVHTGEIETVASSQQIPETNLLGFTLTGLTPDGAPLATVQRSNFDIYSMDLDLP